MTLSDSGLAATPPLLFPLATESYERAARSDAPILIVGEPGTGRSTLARHLHGLSRRSRGPLIEVAPGAIPSTLFESEFFGYRAGAFSGALETTPGRVERSEGGTLVLDHVEDLPVVSQPKLLRLLAERRYAPLGGEERSADVRFIAIGSHELAERVLQGTFRQDLFYRLEVLAFELPPLRHRRADLPQLTRHLLADLCDRHQRGDVELAPASLVWIATYDWLGNLRQLRNVLERALILHQDGPLDPPPPEDVLVATPRDLAIVEKEEIQRCLAYTRGHQGRAAQLLGISRKALWEKRRRYGIP